MTNSGGRRIRPPLSIADDVVPLNPEDGRVGKVDEPFLVGEQQPACGASCLGHTRRSHGSRAIVPKLGNTVVGRKLAAAASQSTGKPVVVKGVRLDIAADAKRLGNAANKRCMLIEPIVLKFGQCESGQPPQAEFDGNHGQTFL